MYWVSAYNSFAFVNDNLSGFAGGPKESSRVYGSKAKRKTESGKKSYMIIILARSNYLELLNRKL